MRTDTHREPDPAIHADSYRTAELEIAAFLRAKNHRLLNARQRGPVVEFEFPAAAAEDVERYFQGAEVVARELLGAHRELRALIAQIREHAQQNRHNGTEKRYGESY